jgi:broad specificity phosphatase PhoE
MTTRVEQEKTTVILLRHGETEWNREGRWQGQAMDTQLTGQGREQARIVAHRLQSYPVDVIYCSDLSRALETAQIVGQVLGKTPLLEPALRESDVGLWTGKTWAEITAGWPEQVAAMLAGEDVRRGDGESYGELQQRLAGALERIIARHPNQTVLVVSHGAALRSLVAHVLGASLAQMHRLAIGGNTAISIVQAQQGVTRLVSYNDTAHLDGALVQVARAEVASE